MSSQLEGAWEKIQRGDLKVFEMLYKEMFPKLYAYTYKILKDKFISEEVVQSVFIRIWQSRESITIKNSLISYLYSTAHHLAINAAIQENTLKNSVNQYTSEGLWQKIQNTFASDESISKEIEAKETEEKIKSIINTMPGQCKTVFLLSRYKNLSNKEIAQVLNISVHTVRTQIYRALEKIIKELEK
jgi:RNA polymerase sigma-70 factor (family 1)